jgi:putative PIN family toxin of toxin-antitoxin system
MNVVVDTNVFVISLTSKSPYHKIFTALRNQEYSISVSNDILLEYHEIIEQKYSIRAAHEFLNLLGELPNVSFINVYYNWHLIDADKDDNKFVDCGIAAQVDFIVSEDGHFNILKKTQFPKVKVIGVEEFLKMLS